MAVADASFKTSIDSMSSGAIADKGLVSVSEERFSSLTAPSCRFETPEFTQIGRAHVWNSSHLGISYAVFCLKKKKMADRHRIQHHRKGIESVRHDAELDVGALDNAHDRQISSRDTQCAVAAQTSTEQEAPPE